MATTDLNERITYIGRRANRDGKLLYHYKWEGEEMAFKRALVPATPGAQLLADITTNDAGTGRNVGNVRYTGDRTVGDEVTTWAALDAAAAGANEARIKATKTDPLMEALAPIREAYMLASPVERAAIITKVVAHITSYGGTKR